MLLSKKEKHTYREEKKQIAINERRNGGKTEEK